jgi:hypothetical protein
MKSIINLFLFSMLIGLLAPYKIINATGNNGGGSGWDKEDLPKGRKRSICTYCGDSFKTWGEKNEHESMHHEKAYNPEVDYRCLLCTDDKPYITLGGWGMYHHLEKVHGITTPPDAHTDCNSAYTGKINWPQKVIRKKTVTKPDKFKCLLCDTAFKNFKAILKHLETNHSDDEKYPGRRKKLDGTEIKELARENATQKHFEDCIEWLPVPDASDEPASAAGGGAGAPADQDDNNDVEELV